MKTIETTATVTPNGELVVQTLADIPPGQYDVVVVLNGQASRQLVTQDRDAWRRGFEALLATVHMHTEQFDSIEIEADITAAEAEAEAKELRNARRGAG